MYNVVHNTHSQTLTGSSGNSLMKRFAKLQIIMCICLNYIYMQRLSIWYISRLCKYTRIYNANCFIKLYLYAAFKHMVHFLAV